MAIRQTRAWVLIAAACFAGGPGVLSAQGPDAELGELIKRRIDAALARTVRELRAELHRIVDESLAGENSIDALLRELDRMGGREPDLARSKPRRPDRATPGLDAANSDLRAVRATWEDLGLRIAPAGEGEQVPGGLVVAKVEGGSPAERAGLQPGDRIARVRDRPALPDSVFPPGGEIALEVLRGHPLPVNISLPVSVPEGTAILARRMVADMSRRALDEVLPSGGVILPAGGSQAPPPPTPPVR